MGSTIAVQGLIGPPGGKAVTSLSYNFNSLGTIAGHDVAASSDGLFLLNSGSDDNDAGFTSSFILATTDLGISNPKRLRYCYIGIDTSSSFVLSVKADEQAWRDYTVDNVKTGMQRIRVPVGRDGQGRYWTIKIASSSAFRVDKIEILTMTRSSGIVGY